jgi:dipeptidase
MCDTFCALPAVTRNHSVILAKSSDCEVNEAQYIYRVPARKHVPGEEFMAAHIVIPQVAETYEAVISRSFWTWGGELGINEHGLAVGNEAVFSNVVPERDGLVVTDMLRLALERARTAEATPISMVAISSPIEAKRGCWKPPDVSGPRDASLLSIRCRT